MMGLCRRFSKLKNYKNGIIYNMVLNTIATGIPVVLLQLLILPYVSRMMNEDNYGLLISITSLLNIVPFSLGNSLSGIRLLKRHIYEDNKTIGDYSVIKTLCLILSAIIVCIFTAVYYSKNGFTLITCIHIVATTILSIMWFLREYYTVDYLLNLEYKNILFNNIILCFGYIIGVLCFKITGIWEVIYLIGYVLSLIHMCFTTTIWKEKFRTSKLFLETLKDECVYFSASLLYRIPAYADKMMLYPILGGSFVSVYYVATLSGKVLTMIVSPVTNVMLSYLSKSRDGKKSFSAALCIGTIVCILGYIICVIISRPVLGLLYPQYVDRSMEYIPITTASVMVSVLIAIINPYILRNKSINWQLIINIVTLVVYIALSLGLYYLFGAIGFCYGVLLTNIGKLIMMLFVYYTSK